MRNRIPIEEFYGRGQVIDALNKGRYETSPGGILCRGVHFGGVFEVWDSRSKITTRDKNLVVNQGLYQILLSSLTGGSAISTWYIAPYTGSISPSATQAAGGTFGGGGTAWPTVVTETSAYDEATRQLWNYDAMGATDTSVDNDTNRATFTINATITVRGAGILSASAKAATTGTLLCYANFGTARSLVDNDVLTIKYTITATSS